MFSTEATYRPYLNRHRVIYVLHQEDAESESIARIFSEQGFIVSTTKTVNGLIRLIDLRRPDVALLDLAAFAQDKNLIPMLRSLVFGLRVFLLGDSNPDTLEVVRAVRSGALSVFTRPYRLTDMVHTVVDELRNDIHATNGGGSLVQGMSSLTPREEDVLRHIIAGDTNKLTAVALGISPRTVEVHRASAMHKLGARNTAEMIRIALANGPS